MDDIFCESGPAFKALQQMDDGVGFWFGTVCRRVCHLLVVTHVNLFEVDVFNKTARANLKGKGKGLTVDIEMID
jgi:hypothetical protein